MRTCIYCLKPEPSVTFKKTAHVIPQSFGKFEQNLTANGMECDACNQFFGDNLELVLSRDTLEGNLRVPYGIKRPGDFKPIGSATRLVVPAPSGPYKGAPRALRYDAGSTTPTLDQVPAVGLSRRNTDEKAWFAPADIPRREDLDPRVYDLEAEGACVVLSDRPDEIIAMLTEKGYKLDQGRSINEKEADEEIDATIRVRIDPPVTRAVSKIAFNYLAAVYGSEFVLQSQFDPLRRFIRHGEGLSPGFFIPSSEQILADEQVNGDVRRVHLLTIHFDRKERCLVGQVSLFNLMKYTITFARELDDRLLVEAKGHGFNLATMCIWPLNPSEASDAIRWNV